MKGGPLTKSCAKVKGASVTQSSGNICTKAFAGSAVEGQTHRIWVIVHKKGAPPAQTPASPQKSKERALEVPERRCCSVGFVVLMRMHAVLVVQTSTKKVVFDDTMRVSQVSKSRKAVSKVGQYVKKFKVPHDTGTSRKKKKCNSVPPNCNHTLNV